MYRLSNRGILKMNMFTFSLIAWLIIVLNGCDSRTTYEEHGFIEDGKSSIYFYGHKDLCKTQPDDMLCKTDISIGDIKPTREYALEILNEMNSNFRYKGEDGDIWVYNSSIHENLVGDCEDIAMTMIHHMIEDGIDRKHIIMATELWSDNVWHIFVGLNTDEGWLHLDYYGSGVPMSRTNYYMKMTDVGVYKWIKGSVI